jgi:ATP-dependent RNA helicase DeaD
LNFNDFGLSKELILAIEDLNFEVPTPIQEKIIPHILSDKRDVVGLAQTGTGKTAAFGLPLLDLLEKGSKYTQVLILCPTRELCLQISRDFESFSKHLPGYKVTPVYGGAPMDKQIRDLRKGSQIIIATPGRLLDLLNRGVADITSIHYLVLDEADIMLNMGFKEELDGILESTPKEKQTLLFSATMPDDVSRIASTYMSDPVEISVGTKNAGVESVDHLYYMVHARDKYQALKRIADYNPDMYGIIFCRTRIATKDIAEKMMKDGYNADALHGDLSQVQREYVMKKFRERSLQLLVATDIAARGLDVKNVSHVIHYDLPDEIEIYTHRSGRTGRAGKTGISIAIIHMKEKYRIRQIERVLKRKISPAHIPMGKDICEKQLMNLIDRVKAVHVDSEQISPYMSIIEEKLAALDRESLLQHFVSMEFNRFLSYYKNTPDLTPVVEGSGSSGGRAKGNSFGSRGKTRSGDRDRGRQGRGNAGFASLIINLGKKERILPNQIIGIINESTRQRNIEIGKIVIGEISTRVDVDENYADSVIQAISGFKYKGRDVRMRRFSDKKKNPSKRK